MDDHPSSSSSSSSNKQTKQTTTKTLDIVFGECYFSQLSTSFKRWPIFFLFGSNWNSDELPLSTTTVPQPQRHSPILALVVFPSIDHHFFFFFFLSVGAKREDRPFSGGSVQTGLLEPRGPSTSVQIRLV